MDTLFSTLRTSPRGLTSATAAARLRICGSNELETKKQGKILAYLPLAVEAAAVVAMAVGLAKGGGYGDGAVGFAFVALLAADFAVGFAESSRAAKSVAADLLARLAPSHSQRTFWVLRDAVWSSQDATALVLGDIIHIKSGDVVPVDARLLEESPPMIIKIDQSTLTGDPLLTAKGPGDAVYAGSACAKGEAQAVVVSAGGVQTHHRQAVLLAVTEATIGIGEWNLDVWMLGALWNASLEAVCFNVLAYVVAGHVSHNSGGEIAAMVVIAFLFALTGWALSMSSADQWQRRPQRDPEELMRRLQVLREQGKVSEEPAQRCRDLLGMEPVRDELAAALANYYGR